MGHQRETGSFSYGISQQKLALAAGITRPYLSDIETGKAHPSEALQEAITEALETLPIQTIPLKCSLIMFRIRFHYGCEAYRGRRAALNSPTLSMKITASAHTEHYYHRGYFRSGIAGTSKGCCWNWKRAWLRQFESYLLHRNGSWYEFHGCSHGGRDVEGTTLPSMTNRNLEHSHLTEEVPE